MPERCNGRDPAYPGLKCYLDKGHYDSDCEFTDANGEFWRARAIDAEKKLSDLSWQISDGGYR